MKKLVGLSVVCVLSILIFAEGISGADNKLLKLLEDLRSGNPDAQQEGRRIFESIPAMDLAEIKADLPYLIKAMTDTNQTVVAAARGLLVGFVLLRRPDTWPVLRDAVPVITRQLGNHEHKATESAIIFLAKVQPDLPQDAIDAMVEMLHDEGMSEIERFERQEVKRLAIAALAGIKPMRRQILDELLKVMKDRKDPLARNNVIASLGANKVDDPEVLQELIGSLEATNVYEQRAAAEALRQIGVPARAAIPALRKLTLDSTADEMAVQNARLALKQLEEPQQVRRPRR